MNTLADVFKRELWTTEDIRNSSELTNLINSTIIVSDSSIDAKVNAEDSGSYILIPYVQEDLYSEANIMDDSNTDITTNKITKKQAKAWVGFFSKAWGEKAIVRAIGSGVSAIDAAQKLLGNYWKKDIQARMISTLTGAIASNKANEASDNVLVDTANQFSYSLAVDTLSKAGENMNGFVAMAVHSSVYAQILKNNAASITVVQDELGFKREYFNGLELMISDNLPIVVDAVNGNRATTVFLRPGAFVFSEATVEIPVETFRNPLSGKGGADEKVISRYAYLLTLNGYSFTATAVAGVSPSIAELANALNWERLVDAGQAPFVALEAKI